MTMRLRQQRARWHNRFASGHRRNMVVALLSLLVAVATISAPVVQAQESASRQSSVLFVVDTSGSMSGSPTLAGEGGAARRDRGTRSGPGRRAA